MSAGVVAALKVEARTLGARAPRDDGLFTLRDGILLAIGGMGAVAAQAAARRLVTAGADSLISWGVAGGLDPALCAGTICLPSIVLSSDGQSFGTDLHWRELVGAAVMGRQPRLGGTLLTHHSAIDEVAGKAAVWRDTGAEAVDMESVAVAEVAAHHTLPFIAVRVIVDTAADTLPRVVMAASRAGDVSMARLLQGLVRSPGQLAPLLRLAARYRAAAGALASVAHSGALALPVFATAAQRRIA